MTAQDPMLENGNGSKRRFPWLKAALVMSLALNLLFVGGAAARFFTHDRPERISGISQMQLVPKRFFGELDRQRRSELLSVFKEYRDEFREGRSRARDEMMNLANALIAEPYDPTAVKSVVDRFSQTSAGLIGQGGEAALTFIGKLTPEERQVLARHIRLRGESNHRKKDRHDRDD